MKVNHNTKTCPFIGKLCLGENCAIFSQQFGRCAIEILAFNMFKTSNTLKSTTDNYYDIDY